MKTTKIILIISALILILILTGCTQNKATRCSLGANCDYYTGSEGIIMQPEDLPRQMYYYTADLGTSDGNQAEFNLRLKNEGASDAYGATYITGFAPEFFKLKKVVKGQDIEIPIGTAKQRCYFSFTGIGEVADVALGCFGVAVGYTGGSGSRFGANIDVGTVANYFGWNLPVEVASTNIGIKTTSTGGLQIDFRNTALGAIEYFRNGKSLLTIVNNAINFEPEGIVYHLQGDNPDNPGGDLDFATFKAQMYKSWPAGTDSFNVPYQIKNCYAYTTFASPTLCVDPDPFSVEDKVCTDNIISYQGSQGGPVAVTNIQQTNTGKELILDIEISNVGRGDVWDVGYLEACNPYFDGRVTANMKNIVYIGHAWIGDTPLDCSRNFKVRLDPTTQNAQFTCTYDVAGNAGNIGSAYTTPLRLEMWYGYEESFNDQITIRRIQ